MNTLGRTDEEARALPKAHSAERTRHEPCLMRRARSQSPCQQSTQRKAQHERSSETHDRGTDQGDPRLHRKMDDRLLTDLEIGHLDKESVVAVRQARKKLGNVWNPELWQCRW